MQAAESTQLKERALNAAGILPFAGGVLKKSLGLYSGGRDLTVTDLASNVEQDVVIAGTVLSMANSAIYGGRSPVSSVRTAIVRLGIDKTRNILLGLSVTRGFRTLKLPAACWSSARFNRHSLASAVLSDLIARNVQSADAEWAFMAGLLHDIGLLLMAAGLPQELGQILNSSIGEATLVDREREVLGFTHFELGAELLGRWNCPNPVSDAARFCRHSSIDLEPPLALGAVVKSATVLADSQGISNVSSSEQIPDIAEELLEALEIKQPADFIAEFRADYDGLEGGV